MGGLGARLEEDQISTELSTSRSIAGTMLGFDPPFLLKKLLHRWSRQQESAVGQMVNQKSVGQRLDGYAKSERADAKFLLLAMLPSLPIAFSDELGWTRGTLWHVWSWLSIAWAICIGAWGFVGYLPVLRRWRGRKP